MYRCQVRGKYFYHSWNWNKHNKPRTTESHSLLFLRYFFRVLESVVKEQINGLLPLSEALWQRNFLLIIDLSVLLLWFRFLELKWLGGEFMAFIVIDIFMSLLSLTYNVFQCVFKNLEKTKLLFRCICKFLNWECSMNMVGKETFSRNYRLLCHFDSKWCEHILD